MIFLLFSCDDYWFNCLRGNGIVVNQERESDHFSGVISEGDFDIIIITDSVCKAVVVADENLLPYIRTSVRGDNLVVNK